MFDKIMTTLVLAAPGGGGEARQGAEQFLYETAAGSMILTLLGALGVAAVIYGGIKVISAAMGGKTGAAGKTLFTTIAVVALLWNPGLVLSGIDVMGKVISGAVSSVSDLTK
jgi:hypothetical protein